MKFMVSVGSSTAIGVMPSGRSGSLDRHPMPTWSIPGIVHDVAGFGHIAAER